jgi:septation ring formation regulator EzrA
MPSIDSVGRQEAEWMKSRIGKSLLKLHRSLERNRRQDEQVETLFEGWQRKWTDHRSRITQRLELIETQLDELADGASSEPKLAVVGALADASEGCR